MSRRAPALLLTLALLAAPAVAAAAGPFELAYTVAGNPDEEVVFPTFLDGDVLMVGHLGEFNANVYDAGSGALRATLECPRRYPEDLRYELEHCPTGVGASRGLLAVAGDSFLYVFDRSGVPVRTIEAPRFVQDSPSFYKPFAVRGRRILVGGASDDGRPGGTVYLFDAPTGAILRRYVNPSPGTLTHFGAQVAFLGRRVVVAAPGDGEHPGAVIAFDADTEVPLWTSRAPAPAPDDAFGADMTTYRGDVFVAPGAHRLDGSTGRLVQTYRQPDGQRVSLRRNQWLAAQGGRVAFPSTYGDAMYLVDADTGALREIVVPPDPPRCAGFAGGVQLARGLLLATGDGYCGGGREWMFRR